MIQKFSWKQQAVRNQAAAAARTRSEDDASGSGGSLTQKPPTGPGAAAGGNMKPSRAKSDESNHPAYGTTTSDSDDEYDSSESSAFHRTEGGDSVRRFRPRSDGHLRTSSHSRRHYSRRSAHRPKSLGAISDLPSSVFSDKQDSFGESPSSPQTSPKPPPRPRRRPQSAGHISYTHLVEGDTPGILEDNLQRLKDINNGIAALRQQNNNLVQPNGNEDGRKESLARFSTSCPSLARDMMSPAQIPHGTDGHFKSLLDLTGSSENVDSGAEPRSDEGGGPYDISPHHDYPSTPHALEPPISILINDITVDSTDDFSTQESDNETSIEQIKKSRRRSSWCPEEGRKKEERSETQRMLGISGRSQSLSSLDGQEDSDEESLSDASDYSTGRVSPNSSYAHHGSPERMYINNIGYHDVADSSLSPDSTMCHDDSSNQVTFF